jgi:hypothetical protein
MIDFDDVRVEWPISASKSDAADSEVDESSSVHIAGARVRYVSVVIGLPS